MVAPLDLEFSVETNCDAIFRHNSTCSRTEGKFFPGINMMMILNVDTICLLYICNFLSEYKYKYVCVCVFTWVFSLTQINCDSYAHLRKKLKDRERERGYFLTWITFVDFIFQLLVPMTMCVYMCVCITCSRTLLWKCKDVFSEENVFYFYFFSTP